MVLVIAKIYQIASSRGILNISARNARIKPITNDRIKSITSNPAACGMDGKPVFIGPLLL